MLKLKFNFLDKEFNRKIKLILLLLVAGMILETISLGMFLPVMNILFANPAENIFINFIKIIFFKPARSHFFVTFL